MKLCLTFNHPHRILSLWDSLSSTEGISYVLLLKCCLKSDTIDFPKSLQIIRWIKDRNYIFRQFELRDYSGYLTTLLSKHKHDLHSVKQIHSALHPRIENNLYVKTSLMRAYASCRDIHSALDIFNSIDDKQKDGSVINCMMTAFEVNGMHSHILKTYDTFHLLRDDLSHLMAIKACISLNDRAKGEHIIDTENLKDLHRNSQYLKYRIPLQNMLINFYGHFGDVESALDIFNNLATKDQGADSVSNMMRAMLANGWNEQVLLLYGMHSNLPNAEYLHSHALRACVNLKNIDYGKRICNKLQGITSSSNDSKPQNAKKRASPRMKSAMIGFYGDIGELESARKLVDFNNVFNVGVMMKMYLRHNKFHEVLELYEDADSVNNHISHLHALKACIGCGDVERGKAIHRKLEEEEEENGNGNALSIQMKSVLIEFYAKFGDLERAIDLFVSVGDEQKDVQIVATMMNALIEYDGSTEGLERALKLYDVYWCNSNATHVLALKCCIALNDAVRGSKIERTLRPKEEGNIHLINTLIDYHGHFGNVKKAEEVFDLIHPNDRDIVTVGALMNVYCENEMEAECLKLFGEIKKYRYLVPNAVCFSIALKACTQSGMVHLGKEIHDEAASQYVEVMRDKEVVINLMTLYGKHGMVTECRDVFDGVDEGMKKRQIGIWNAMINGYGRNGEVDAAHQMMVEMEGTTDLKADRMTLGILLNSCSHSGEEERAMEIWRGILDEEMKYNSYVMTSLIDCFARKGMLQRAMELLAEYEEKRGDGAEDENDKAMWVAVLSGCNKHGETELGKRVYEVITNRYEEGKKKNSAASNGKKISAADLLQAVYQSDCGLGEA